MNPRQGGEGVSCGHMPHLITSFPLPVEEQVLSSSCPSFVIILAVPHHIRRPRPVPAADVANAAVTFMDSLADPPTTEDIIVYMTSMLSVLMSFIPLPTSWNRAH